MVEIPEFTDSEDEIVMETPSKENPVKERGKSRWFKTDIVAKDKFDLHKLELCSENLISVRGVFEVLL